MRRGFLDVAQRDPGVQSSGNEGMPERVRRNGLADPGAARGAADDPPGAELVAVQRGMGLIVHPRTADVGGRGVIQEFLFDRVLEEPGDGGEPAGDGRAGAALASSSLAKLSMSARRAANKARERTRHQVVNWRRSSA
jgi:hypothetical protein